MFFSIPPVIEDELTEKATNKENILDDDNFVASDTDNSTKLFNQAALNDLVRELDLSKEKAELIASGLQERNMLQKLHFIGIGIERWNLLNFFWTRIRWYIAVMCRV